MNLRGAIVMFEMGHPIEEDRYDDSFQKLKREWKYELVGQLGRSSAGRDLPRR